MFEPHPNLHDGVNLAISENEIAGGADLRKLQVGKKLIVQCQDCTLTVERRETGLYISGHERFCPHPMPCSIPGSVYWKQGTMLKMHWIGRGMFMEFHTEIHPQRIVTSEVLEITEV